MYLVAASATAQSLDIATRLSPWPPPGWPAGAQGEVRLTAVNLADGSEAGDTGLAFPVSEAGDITYRLPETLPRAAAGLYRPFELSEIALCADAYPIVSPPDVEVVILTFQLYADGEPWGEVDMTTTEQPGMLAFSVRQFVGAMYTLAPLQVGGRGVCPGEQLTEVTYDLDLQEGRNLVVMEVDATLSGTSLTVTTSETIDIPGIPAGY